MRILLFATALAALVVVPALAQQATLRTPSGQIVNGNVLFCPNGITNADGSQQAVPCSTAQPIPEAPQVATNNALGAPGSSPCPSDVGICSANALLQRVAQRITTLIGSIWGGSGFPPSVKSPGLSASATDASLAVAQRSFISAGSGQFALAIGTNTMLSVPAGTVCAQVTLETANIRRTSDGTGATTTNGTLITSGAQWQDCGPLAAYKFTAVSGSPTLDVEYFK